MANCFSAKVQNILYKGASLEYYVNLENNQEIRIRVETKSFSPDEITGEKITIGWNERDTVVLKRASE